ncbi:hypothetical protein TNCV_163221 [Trichonephila clavipes]|nr:hypothetical protein TNCV_163221 [Trichonephila clavipes]
MSSTSCDADLISSMHGNLDIFEDPWHVFDCAIFRFVQLSPQRCKLYACMPDLCRIPHMLQWKTRQVVLYLAHSNLDSPVPDPVVSSMYRVRTVCSPFIMDPWNNLLPVNRWYWCPKILWLRLLFSSSDTVAQTVSHLITAASVCKIKNSAWTFEEPAHPLRHLPGLESMSTCELESLCDSELSR